MSDIFSPEATQKQVRETLDALPTNEARVGVIAKDGDVGIVGEGRVDPGHPGGLFVEGQVSWWRRAGRSAAAFIGWKPRG